MLVDWLSSFRSAPCSVRSDARVAFRSVYWTLTSLEFELRLMTVPMASTLPSTCEYSAAGTLITT